MKIKIAVIAIVAISLGVNAQLDSNNNFQIGYKKKIYSVSSEPYKFEMIPFGIGGNTEFRNYYASGKYQFYVSDGTHGNGNKLGLLINHDGNIGIGTMTPSKTLDVRGDIISGAISASTYGYNMIEGRGAMLQLKSYGNDVNTFNQWSLYSHTTNGSLHFRKESNSLNTQDLITFNSIGYVGIGTTSPVEKLHIENGAIQFKNLGSINDVDIIKIAETTTLNEFSIKGMFQGGGSSGNAIKFSSYWTDNMLHIRGDGNIGIGTNDTKGFKLGVNGKIAAEEVKVALHSEWSDFVFKNDYYLPTLKEVENHIKERGHLKDIPSAKEVEKNGIFLGEMDAKLLQKIEELTLYTIQQQKEIQALKEEKKELKSINTKLLELQKRLDKLEKK